MMTKNPVLNFVLMDDRWTLREEDIFCALAKASALLNEDLSDMEVSVVLSNDHHVQELNKAFRHKDYATNVLSFCSEMEGELGDIILAYETVMREAHEMVISPFDHTLHLIIHGFLHLLGYDHEEDDDAIEMEDMEIRILETLDIKNPYEVL